MQMKAFWPNWQVIGETTPQAAMQRLRSLAEPGAHLPNLVSVDLGLPPDANRPWVGLKLLKEIQHNFGGIRLVVHSSLAVVDEVMHTILAVPASYVQIRDSESVLAFAIMMPFLARGYLVYSSTPGSQFPRAVVTAPDPLSHDDWELLALIAQTDPHLTLEDIAERLHVDTSRISQRVRTIAQRLDPQFIQVDSSRTYEPHKFRPKLDEFYRSYCARFGRS
jgi:DNA-binding NarL/FixJ family response regulator